MCGICGIVEDRPRAELERETEVMRERLRHRGPDDGGLAAGEGWALGHRRLAVVDLSSAGHQPMPPRGGGPWLVYNGEVYNAGALRERLEGLGWRFRGHSDSEVVQAALETWGEEALPELRGQFALAAWWPDRRELLLARDPMGIRPLLVQRTGAGLRFASELAALGGVDGLGGVSLESLREFLVFQYVPHPHSIAAGVMKLPPGHKLRYRAGGAIEVARYAGAVDAAAPGPSAPAEAGDIRDLERRLLESVRMRLIADVPIGLALSGGLDSSLLLALLYRLGRRGVPTFGVSFDHPDYDEGEYAERVAARFEARHTRLPLDAAAWRGALEGVLARFGEPFGDSSVIAVDQLVRACRTAMVVCLTGDGSDELFGGYHRHIAHARRRGSPDVLARAYLDDLAYFRPEELAALLPDAGAREPPEAWRRQEERLRRGGGSLAAVLAVDRDFYLPGVILAKSDAVGMAHALEIRVPYLDPAVAAWARALNDRQRCGWGLRKRALKRLARTLLPWRWVYRRKLGFTAPLQHWLRGELGRELEARLDDLASGGLFAGDVMRALLDEHRRGAANHARKLWLLLVYHIWWQAHGRPGLAAGSRWAA